MYTRILDPRLIVLPILDPTLPALENAWVDDRPILQIFLRGLNSVSCTLVAPDFVVAGHKTKYFET
jgi:hypothetical protein